MDELEDNKIETFQGDKENNNKNEFLKFNLFLT